MKINVLPKNNSAMKLKFCELIDISQMFETRNEKRIVKYFLLLKSNYFFSSFSGEYMRV